LVLFIIVNRMEADLNVSSQSIVQKGRGLCSLIDWKSPAY